MSATVNPCYLTIKLSPEALTVEHLKSHKVEFMQMISSVVVALIADVYNTSNTEPSKMTDKQVTVICDRLKRSMNELQPSLEIAKKLTKDKMIPYADWTKFIKAEIAKEQPEVYQTLCDQRIQQLSKIRGDHFILANLIKFIPPSNS
jgi:hypothetical protein